MPLLDSLPVIEDFIEHVADSLMSCLLQDGIALAARTLLRERDRPRASTTVAGAGVHQPSETPSPAQLAADAAFLITCLRALTTFYPGLRAYFLLSWIWVNRESRQLTMRL